MRSNQIVLLLVLLIVLVIVGFFVTNPEQGQQILVDLGLATPVAENYTASGLLEAKTYSLGPLDAGRLAELYVDEGETVQAGQSLFLMETELLELHIEAAQAGVDAAQAVVDMLQSGARQVDLDVAEAAVAQAQAALEAAQQAVEDARDSAPEAIKDEQVALAEAQVDAAQANLDAANAGLAALKRGAAQTDLDAAQAALEAAQAELARLEEQLARQTIASPIDGVVLEDLLLPGELALPGWPVLTVADLGRLELTVYIPEADLNWVQVGAKVQVKVDAYPDKTFNGTVTFIADQAEFTPRNVQTPDERVILVYAVKVLVPNPEGLLKPGLPADAIFEVQG